MSHKYEECAQTENHDAEAPIPSPPTFWTGFKAVALCGPLNILLVAAPVSLYFYYTAQQESWTFFLALATLAPLAERLGFVTEHLAHYTNDTMGGLLNATFGNATELIVAVLALTKGLFRLVQLSLLGSVLSNLLLVLGCAFFFGGIKHSTQHFGVISSQINSTLLMASVMGIIFPTILTYSLEESFSSEIGFSRATSLILFLLYFAFLFFQIFTHREAYETQPEEAALLLKDGSNRSMSRSQSCVIKREQSMSKADKDLSRSESNKDLEIATSEVVAEESDLRIPESPKTALNNTTVDSPKSIFGTSNMICCAMDTTKPGLDTLKCEEKSEASEEEEMSLTLYTAIFWLTIITVLIAVLSDAIVNSVEFAAVKFHISGTFLAAIVIPIVGNAAEHASAVMFGMKNKLEISLGVAIGSSTQIAVMLIPLTVMLGWIIGKDMSLNFHLYESFSVFLAVVLVTFSIKDGTSNWLSGLILIAAYSIIAFGFFAQNDEDLSMSTLIENT